MANTRDKQKLTAADAGTLPSAGGGQDQALPDDWKGNLDGTPKVVEAAAVMAGQGALTGPGGKSPLARIVEAAMSQAVLQANADGISTSQAQEIKARMMEARQRVLDAWRNPETQPAVLEWYQAYQAEQQTEQQAAADQAPGGVQPV